MCQRRGSWPAVRSHGPCIHCHPWITTRWRHTEQVRDKRRAYFFLCVWIYNVYWEMITCIFLLCCRRNCIISAYYQQRETHKPSMPNVSVNSYLSHSNQLSTCYFLNTIKWLIFFIACRAWEAPEGLDFLPRTSRGTVINVNLKTVFFICEILQKGKRSMNRDACLHCASKQHFVITNRM